MGGGAPIDLGPRYAPHARHARMRFKARFLRSYRQHLAQVIGGWGYLQRGEGRINVGGPALPVRRVGRH